MSYSISKHSNPKIVNDAIKKNWVAVTPRTAGAGEKIFGLSISQLGNVLGGRR